MNWLNILSNINFLGVGSLILMVLAIIALIVIYLCKSVGIYLLSLRTKQKNTWMSFIPILQDIKVFNMAGLSTKVYVVFYFLYRALLSAKLELKIFAPIWVLGIIIYIIGLLYVRYQMAKNFGGSQLICILNTIFEPFVLLYFVFKGYTHQYTNQAYAKVETYLRAYGLYEDPSTFIDPDAKPEPTFKKTKQQTTPNQNYANHSYQNPYGQQQANLNINLEKDDNPINLNTDK